MSAARDLTFPIPPNVAEAAIQKMEEQEGKIATLTRQRDHFIAENAVLQEELNGAQLRLSLEETKRRLHEHNVLVRLVALEKHMDRIANHAMGLPQREEFEQLKSDYYSHSARSSC